MASWIAVVSYLQTCYEAAVLWWNGVRRDILFPYAAAAGRDMILLRSEQWVDASVKAPAEDIQYRYNVLSNTVTRPEQDASARMVRWPWISVTYNGDDISDFFQGLRLPAGHTLTHNQLLLLFTHQKGVYPAGELQVITRDGTEETVYAFRHRPAPEHIDNGVDYIR